MTVHPKLTPGLLAVLSFLAATGPFATDMYLSSFTQIASDLGAPASSVQLTLTAFLLGIGSGQLVLGPLSDQWGRRPILLVALSVFAATSVAMVFSPNVGVLIGLRFLQGFAGAAGVVVSRAIAVDLTEGAAAIRAISLIAMFVGLGPLIAPPVGGAIAAVADWRAVLATLAGLAVAMLVLAAVLVPESLPRERRNAAGLRAALRNFAALLGDRGFLLLMCVFGLGFGGMMAYISASPFVGQIILGMSPFVYSLAFAAGALAMITANLINARLAGKVPATRMLFIGTVFALLAGTGLTVLATSEALTPASFIACAFTLTGGTGLIMSNASALALARAGAAKGSGSALLGASQFAVGGLASPLVGAWGEHTAVPMAVFVLGVAVLACVGAVIVHRTTPR
ncbi:multidrug effflux MFS transporter [Leucobacter luti]|uniref:DHA1 family bicyclomycin/chloramphenicol resistance-like MFS transporter n=1 Tax=Leucobacter luti TaxID=340320 RepID=A0A4Q7U856_9MICO|nr:multidrug effflux MFS transporter [Leucobacter luti]MBL3700591.1 Bcr/CflA family efflux MFS transporter [Leucobacter luti]RZT68572.1 DHA1 family bicyclomycin/chloramphenicol resistance-like MFS transporter [Leucobacter luti]